MAHFTLKPTTEGMLISANGKSFFDTLHSSSEVSTSSDTATSHVLSRNGVGYSFTGQTETYGSGEIIDIVHTSKVTKQTLKFTFDTFYVDAQSVGIVAGYTLKDRAELASNGVITFVLEEDVRARAIVGHIFIDSRGFVHSHEMMSVHKEVLKAIRHIYESTIIANTRIERGELVQILRRELTKYCYIITGRTPVVMPVIIER